MMDSGFARTICFGAIAAAALFLFGRLAGPVLGASDVILLHAGICLLIYASMLGATRSAKLRNVAIAAAALPAPTTTVLPAGGGGRCCGVQDSADAAATAYAALPDRLYLVGIDGRVAYAGGRGPWGFRPGELGKAIDALPKTP